MKAFHPSKLNQPSFGFFSIFVLILLSRFSTSAQPSFIFNQDINHIYQQIVELKLDEAGQLITQLKVHQPDNLAIDFIEDYIDFIKLYISEDPALLRALANNEDLRLKKINQAAPKNSPYTRYVLAEINLHWAIIHIKFGNYLSSFTRVKRAYQLLQENVKNFPQFSPNLKSLGIIHAMMSTVPDELKWILKTLSGMEGTMAQAKAELEQVIQYADQNDFIFKNETIVMYGLLVANFENDVQSAWNLIRKCNLDPTISPLITYIYTHLSLKNGENDQAIQYLQARPIGKDYYPFPFLDYLLGITKLRRLDEDAQHYLTQFTLGFKGLHYIKECYQKLGWAELIKKNKQGYVDYLQKAKKLGVAVVDEDKQAMREAQSQHVPNEVLLKARLLSDGGYHQQAEKILLSHMDLLKPNNTHHFEATYRLARIYHLQKKYNQAIPSYLQAIDHSKGQSGHYACASYLYTGQIYEGLHYPKLAKYYFEKCLNENPSDYGASLHQKAKSGLNRVRE